MKKSTRGRKPVIRSLPPLAEACSGFTGFQEDERRAERIFALLDNLIQGCRRATPQPFYAMREVAAFFGVSLHTVSAVYRQLDRLGKLTRLRSSQTMIAPRSPRPKFALRGVVCMPIWLPGFVHFRDWRNLFSELEEELSRHRFVLEPVFFKQGEEADPVFVDRILKFNPDYVVWNAPVQADRMTMQSIIDAGVPILSIVNARGPALPGRNYRQGYDQALRRGLADWKADGRIDQIVIPYMADGKSHVTENFGIALQASPLPYQLKAYELGHPMPEYLASLAPDRRTGIFCGDQLFFIRLCAMAAEEMFELFRQHRVLICRQVIMHSWTVPTDISVDWLAFPGRRLARRIATDLSQSKGVLPLIEEVFEAEWQPHTPLGDLAQFYLNE